MGITLNEQLQKELASGATNDDFVVQQLRRQINAAKSGKTFQDLYVTGSVKKPTK